MREARTFTLEEIEEAKELQCGYCLSCGAMRGNCEPDARRYPCEECGKRAVYGAEELILMGRVV
jgi:hypothetical protein